MICGISTTQHADNSLDPSTYEAQAQRGQAPGADEAEEGQHAHRDPEGRHGGGRGDTPRGKSHGQEQHWRRGRAGVQPDTHVVDPVDEVGRLWGSSKYDVSCFPLEYTKFKET